MNTVTIRAASLHDTEIIYQFITGLTGQHFDKARFARYFELCLAAPYHHYLVAVAGDAITGYISCHGQLILHHCGLVYEIQELYVNEAYRSQGTGRQLLQALEATIGSTEYELLEVCSNKRRADAHRFYIDNGFEQTSYKFKKHQETGVDTARYTG